MRKSADEQDLVTPGQQLQKARQQKDLSAEMIAKYLRLDVNLIHAIENDDYEKFPAVAYVRGYIRNYANIVDLNGDNLVRSFDQISRKEPVLEPFVSRPDNQAVSADKHIKIVTYSLIAALILMLGLWWQNHRPASEMPAELIDEIVSQPQTEEETIAETVAHEDNNQILPLQDVQHVQQKAEILHETATEPEEPQELKHQFGIVHFSPLPEPPEQIQQADNASDLNQPVQSTEQLNDDRALTLPAEDTIRIEDQGIVLQFTDESWVQISDADDKKLYSGLGKAGEVVNVSGNIPLRVVIGKASAVIMSYQGNFIDLDPLARNEVARFTIDESGAHR